MENFNRAAFEQGQEFTALITQKHYRDSVCDKHGEHQEVGYDFTGKRITWGGCKECQREANEALEKEREVKKQIDAQMRIEVRLKKAGIPERFKSKTFENYVADTPQKKHSLTVARDFSENFSSALENGESLIFSGKAGTGKSHLAIAVALSIMPKHTALYSNALDLIRMVRDTWRKDSEQSELQVLEMLGNIDLLIIDEVGVQYGTDNEQMLMFDIINRRYRDLKPMILLTNLGTTGLAEYLTERSYDRLRENGRWVSFEWESHRAK